MCEPYLVVPWFNSKEWYDVYNKIYSSPTIASRQEALEALLIWKARCPSLPSGIESTLTLLEVYVQDSQNISSNDQLLRLAYSSAIMRFVNHMLDNEIAKGISLYQAAKTLGVPDWIIDLRHDTAHNNVLPSIEILREATLIGLNWLHINYWDKHKEFIEDFITGQVENNVADENRIGALIDFCISLSICSHSTCKIKNLADIPDPNMVESIVSDARDLFPGQDFSNLKNVSVSSLINLINNRSKNLLKTKDAIFYVNKSLTKEESLFLSPDLLSHLSKYEFDTKNKLSYQYVQCFEVLLTFLHTNNLLMEFILELIKITQNSEDCSLKRKLAALWISEILQALKKSQLFSRKIIGSNFEETRNKKRKELKLLVHHWFPSEKNNGLLLDLHCPVPEELTNINFIQPIISAYNPYLTYFVKDILYFIEPRVPNANANKICKLAKMISAPVENSIQNVTKIYTINDVQSNKDLTENSLLAHDVDVDSDCMEVCDESFEGRCDIDCDDQFQNGIWQKASTIHDWSKCPVGLLPWQQNVMNI